MNEANNRRYHTKVLMGSLLVVIYIGAIEVGSFEVYRNNLGQPTTCWTDGNVTEDDHEWGIQAWRDSECSLR